MPLVGQASFLRLLQPLERRFVWCVNALSRASLISTGNSLQEIAKLMGVSMPLVGQASFLHESDRIDPSAETGVNALSRASLISTLARASDGSVTTQFVSMPLVGQASFLQQEIRVSQVKIFLCQCP